jgi:hypothetical protein
MSNVSSRFFPPHMRGLLGQDIGEIFKGLGLDFLPSLELLRHVAQVQGRPWTGVPCDHRTVTALGKFLALHFFVRSTQRRFGKQRYRGYRREDFCPLDNPVPVRRRHLKRAKLPVPRSIQSLPVEGRRHPDSQAAGFLRGRTRVEVAAKFGLSLSSFDKWKHKIGLYPTLPGGRYDDRLVEKIMDSLSGISTSKETTPLDEWRASRREDKG